MGKLYQRTNEDGFVGLHQKHISDPDLIIEISFVNTKVKGYGPINIGWIERRCPTTDSYDNEAARESVDLSTSVRLIRITE